jgi:hypothetical protein
MHGTLTWLLVLYFLISLLDPPTAPVAELNQNGTAICLGRQERGPSAPQQYVAKKAVQNF